MRAAAIGCRIPGAQAGTAAARRKDRDHGQRGLSTRHPRDRRPPPRARAGDPPGVRRVQPVVRDDQGAIATTMTLTLSIDRQAVDGASTVRFLVRLRELIEEPLDIAL